MSTTSSGIPRVKLKRVHKAKPLEKKLKREAQKTEKKNQVDPIDQITWSKK